MRTQRYALTDGQWEALRPLLPPDEPTGRPPKDHRLVLDGILWTLPTGAPWRDLPDRLGPWRSVYHRFDLYRRRGIWAVVLGRLQRRAELDRSQWNIHGTVVRAHRAAAGAGEESAATRGAG